MDTPVQLVLLSVLLVITSIAITIKQLRVKSCPRHRHVAGMLAQTLALLCLLAGIMLLAWVLMTAEFARSSPLSAGTRPMELE
jgi:hypothetical protein